MTNPAQKRTLTGLAIKTFEQTPVPDTLTRLAIRTLVARGSRSFAGIGPEAAVQFAKDMDAFPIAVATDAANAQHYEVPAEFFALVLGPQRKYSSCLYAAAGMTLGQAEEAALAETARHAALADGQSILELGCGWGSLTLWMARNYPNARITAVSNSNSQRASIEQRARDEGLSNVTIITADANIFEPADGARFDRIVSVEMFEHMSNWSKLLGRCRDWLHPDGRMLMHVFTHKRVPYRFKEDDDADWIAQYFFTGGIMPSEKLIHQFPSIFTVEDEWRWSGQHYERTANHWLDNMDANSEAVMRIMRQTYGPEAKVWYRRWRIFFLATAGLFGFDQGREWGVNHYRLKPVSRS
jgi:cyclopropane-fatty-acyl-phospholipid synthase